MKKILGILLLAGLLIFAAGCITAADDEIAGTWEYTTKHSSYTLELYPNGEGVSQGIYTYGGEKESYIFPVWWEKSRDGTYLIEEIYSFMLLDDGTMTDYAGVGYELTDTNLWTETSKGDIYYIYQFNEDGTGSETVCDINGNTFVNPIVWKEYKDGILLYWYTNAYTSTDNGLLIREWEYTFVGDETYVNQTELSTESFTFYEEGVCIKTIRWGEGGKEAAVSAYYTWTEDTGVGDLAGYDRISGLKPASQEIDTGNLIERSLRVYVLEDDGTLVCQESGSVLTKYL